MVLVTNFSLILACLCFTANSRSVLMCGHGSVPCVHCLVILHGPLMKVQHHSCLIWMTLCALACAKPDHDFSSVPESLLQWDSVHSHSHWFLVDLLHRPRAQCFAWLGWSYMGQRMSETDHFHKHTNSIIRILLSTYLYQFCIIQTRSLHMAFYRHTCIHKYQT